MATSLTRFFTALLLSVPSYGLSEPDDGINCCSALKSRMGAKVLLGARAVASVEPYWAAQAEEMRPTCVVQPTTVEDVSMAVNTLANGFKSGWECCKFAIRSGGHTPGANQNNIDGGVTIDLSYLNQVTPDTGCEIVSVGPGNRWEDVYKVLDPLNMTVVGGRSRTVGVGGLLLSGGLSFFSPRYGLPCDNVLNYQLVLADGQVIEANRTSHPDLYKALKGGSNNFGVVTRLDLRAIPQGEFWGGVATYPDSALMPLLNLTYEFGRTESYDPYSQLSLNWGLHGNNRIVTTHNHYTKAMAPPVSVFGDFTSLQTQNTFRIDSMSGFAHELESVNGLGTIRKAFATATYKNDLQMFQRFADLSNKTMQDLKGTVDQFIVSVQPFGQFIMQHSAQTGGNSLGLDADKKDRALYCLTVAWKDKVDDEMVYGKIRQLLDQAAGQARSYGAFDNYIFLNYAAPWQDVTTGYGRHNMAAMQKASNKYDPRGIFQNAVPGGFKLFT
ncbi:hypothetical protein FDECE_4616 [Fusarium decemcellulare]|nr:hypothetical protein FDECE_4616 [Fusarium decemcellulare]